MEIEDIIKLCEQRYIAGLIFKNACAKTYNYPDDTSYDTILYGTVKVVNFNSTNILSELKVQVFCNDSPEGFVYHEGNWADIMDNSGNIVDTFDSEIILIRKWLWK